jgi:hypothetical protein
MSYTFLPGPEGVSSAASFSDIPPSVLSRLNLTVEKSCCSGNEMESSHDSQSGTTCVHSTVDPGGDSLTSLRVDFLAKTYPQPGKAKASTVNAQDCGDKWLGSLTRYDPDSRSWKTAQCLLQGGLEEFSETWPRWGIMQDGVCWERTMQVRHTCESESGSSPKWPTPNCVEFRSDGELRILAKTCKTPEEFRAMSHRAAESKRTSAWPTPRATDGSKGSRTVEGAMKELARGRNKDLGMMVASADGGALNPPWVEWLMGWPIGWTDLQPLAMDKFQAWRHSHGEHLAE